MKDIIVFDIDGTLSIVGDRLECLQKTPKDWDKFYARCGEDTLNEPIAELLDIIFDGSSHTIVFITGRWESCRKVTEQWLDSHFGPLFQTEQLLMRPDGDYRPDTIVKPELAAPFMDRILMVFEDQSSMVKKWRELNIICLQVTEGEF